MPLYTVRIDFEDRTFAIEQLEAEAAQQALNGALHQSEALAKFGSPAVLAMIEQLYIYQVADILGVWNWHVVPGPDGITSEVFGGTIVQTDPAGLNRNVRT